MKKRFFTIGLTAIFLFLSNLGVYAHGGDGDEMMGGRFGNWMSGYWGGYWWLMVLGMILVVVGIAFFIVFLVRRSSGGRGLYGDPLDELKASYARGEIDREEYLRMKDDLTD